MAQLLEERGSDRVLRKLVGREIVATERLGYPRVGVIVDTETTGLDHRKDEVIEIGAVAFTFDDEGDIGDVTGLFGGLQKPTVPIPPEITRLTEITDEMVAGQMIDVGLLGALIDPADVVIAHNARFDRPFCEAFSSMSEIYQWEEADRPLKRLTAFDRYEAGSGSH
ncbi:exonuclease domain-containing protein [Sinorhizobium meliloti]